MRLDTYNILQGQAFAIEMFATAPSNLSVQPIIDNLNRSMGNKPPAQQAGIRFVIELVQRSGVGKVPVATEQEIAFADLVASLDSSHVGKGARS